MQPGLLARGLILSITGAGVLLAFAERRWQAKTLSLIARLDRTEKASPSRVFALSDLEGLPAPVARYFRMVLREGQPIIRQAEFCQEGTFLLHPGEDGWRPFTAVQYFDGCPAGFVWDAQIRMAPGLPVRVRDALREGVGSMQASLMGLIRLASAQGTPEIAAGALHRYLAEAVWCPTALLPCQGVVWTPIDDTHARATLATSGTTVSLDFCFGEDGLVSSVFTPARFRDVDGRMLLTPWQGRFSEYEEREGLRIPLRGEVAWLLLEGPQIYWKGRIVDAVFQATDPAHRAQEKTSLLSAKHAEYRENGA